MVMFVRAFLESQRYSKALTFCIQVHVQNVYNKLQFARTILFTLKVIAAYTHMNPVDWLQIICKNSMQRRMQKKNIYLSKSRFYYRKVETIDIISVIHAIHYCVNSLLDAIHTHPWPFMSSSCDLRFAHYSYAFGLNTLFTDNLNGKLLPDNHNVRIEDGQRFFCRKWYANTKIARKKRNCFRFTRTMYLVSTSLVVVPTQCTHTHIRQTDTTIECKKKRK